MFVRQLISVLLLLHVPGYVCVSGNGCEPGKESLSPLVHEVCKSYL